MTPKGHCIQYNTITMYSSWFACEFVVHFFYKFIRLDSQTHGCTAGAHPLGRNDVSDSIARQKDTGKAKHQKKV